MLKISKEAMNFLEQGGKIKHEVTIYFQVPETYTEDDYLLSAGDLSASMSSEGGYSIANTTITLKNEGYYFSRKFTKELPNNKLVEVFLLIGQERVLTFRGIINKDWRIATSARTLILNVNA